jgi:hypothetical protein
MSDDRPAPDGDPATPPEPPKPEYEVGYRKPPQHGKIKPGEVRNKRGPLKGTRSLKNDIRDVLNMPVPLTGPGKQPKVTTRKAALLKLREKALKGSDRSLDRLLEYAREHDLEEGIIASTGNLLAEDAAILANIRERLAQSIAANAPAPSETPSSPDDMKDKT